MECLGRPALADTRRQRHEYDPIIARQLTIEGGGRQRAGTKSRKPVLVNDLDHSASPSRTRRFATRPWAFISAALMLLTTDLRSIRPALSVSMNRLMVVATSGSRSFAMRLDRVLEIRRAGDLGDDAGAVEQTEDLAYLGC